MCPVIKMFLVKASWVDSYLVVNLWDKVIHENEHKWSLKGNSILNVDLSYGANQLGVPATIMRAMLRDYADPDSLVGLVDDQVFMSTASARKNGRLRKLPVTNIKAFGCSVISIKPFMAAMGGAVPYVPNVDVWLGQGKDGFAKVNEFGKIKYELEHLYVCILVLKEALGDSDQYTLRDARMKTILTLCYENHKTSRVEFMGNADARTGDMVGRLAKTWEVL